jgi:hypothetical protein
MKSGINGKNCRTCLPHLDLPKTVVPSLSLMNGDCVNRKRLTIPPRKAPPLKWGMHPEQQIAAQQRRPRSEIRQLVAAMRPATYHLVGRRQGDPSPE